MLNLIKTKSLSQIAKEWDAIASLRDDQVASGKDHSANYVLAPAILERLSNTKTLLDIGCGTGWLTVRAEAYASVAVGVDPSYESISLAQVRHPGRSIKYIADSIEVYSQEKLKFECAISNMAASCAPNLQDFLVASRCVLKKGAVFIFTIPHPCFWPLYWGYASHPDFKYRETFAVESEFKIQLETSGFLTTHFHHPLELYMSSLTAAGFAVLSLEELAGRDFDFPRFLLIEAKAV